MDPVPIRYRMTVSVPVSPDTGTGPDDDVATRVSLTWRQGKSFFLLSDAGKKGARAKRKTAAGAGNFQNVPHEQLEGIGSAGGIRGEPQQNRVHQRCPDSGKVSPQVRADHCDLAMEETKATVIIQL